MPAPAIQFCDVCQGSIPHEVAVRLANGAVYCRTCYAQLSAKKPEAFPPGRVGPIPKVRLPAWSVVTACVGVLLLAVSVGTTVFLVLQVRRLSERLREVESGVAKTQRMLDDETRKTLMALLNRRPGDPDFANDDRQLITEALKRLTEFSQDYRREIDTTLDEIEHGGRRQPPSRRDRSDTGASRP